MGCCSVNWILKFICCRGEHPVLDLCSPLGNVQGEHIGYCFVDWFLEFIHYRGEHPVLNLGSLLGNVQGGHILLQNVEGGMSVFLHIFLSGLMPFLPQPFGFQLAPSIAGHSFGDLF